MNVMTRYDTLNFLNDINKLLELPLRGRQKNDTSSADTSEWCPAVDIKEDSKQFTILADLPGLDKNDIQISMEDNILIIKGERSSETKENNDNYSRIERVRGSFYRRFTLPDIVDGTKIKALMQKGVLEIIIPKREQAQPRFIDIQT